MKTPKRKKSLVGWTWGDWNRFMFFDSYGLVVHEHIYKNTKSVIAHATPTHNTNCKQVRITIEELK